MENKRDLTKIPLIDLVKGLSNLDRRITELMLEKDGNDDAIEYVKIEYNNIIGEIIRRFPPLKDDVNLQPKTLKKKRGIEHGRSIK